MVVRSYRTSIGFHLMPFRFRCSFYRLLVAVLGVRSSRRLRLPADEPEQGGDQHLHPEPGASQQRRQSHHLLPLQRRRKP